MSLLLLMLMLVTSTTSLGQYIGCQGAEKIFKIKSKKLITTVYMVKKKKKIYGRFFELALLYSIVRQRASSLIPASKSLKKPLNRCF